jgi:hypothetical protein
LRRGGNAPQAAHEASPRRGRPRGTKGQCDAVIAELLYAASDLRSRGMNGATAQIAAGLERCARALEAGQFARRDLPALRGLGRHTNEILAREPR